MAVRKIIQIDEERCTGCGACIPGCAEGALAIVNGKAKVIADSYCDGLGACIGVCPEGALTIIERESDPFDEAAVHARMAALQGGASHTAPASPCACAGSFPQASAPARPAGGCPSSSATGLAPFAIPGQRPDFSNSRWPIKLELAPPTAPWAQGADLLITADCATAAMKDFHQRHGTDTPGGKVVLIACPKLGNKPLQLERLTDLFLQADPKSIGIVRMEVPCCGALSALVRQAAAKAGFSGEVDEEIVPISVSC